MRSFEWRSFVAARTAMFGLVAITVLLIIPATGFAYTGTITGGTANSTWTQGHVDGMSLTMDLCGSDGAPDCKWAALAGVMPAANGNCPNDWYRDGPAVNLRTFWSSGYQSANGMVTSGPQDFTVDGAYGQRVCLYLERTFTLTGMRASWVVYGPLLQVAMPPAPPAAPTPTPLHHRPPRQHRRPRRRLLRRRPDVWSRDFTG